MAQFSKSEFATKCGMKTNGLAVYIRRGAICVGSGGMIDDQNEKNRLFLSKRAGRMTEQQAIKHVTSIEGHQPTRQETVPEDETDGIPPYSISERRLKFLDAEKRQAEISLLKIKEQKIVGSVVPSELLIPVMLQHNKSIMESFRNGATDIIRILAKKRNFTGEERAEFNSQLVKIINDAITRATTATSASITTIVTEYSESRAQGEKK